MARKSKGSVLTNKTSTIYILFYYLGQRVEINTGYDITEKNISVWRSWLDRNIAKINNGTFIFSEALPNASEKQKSKFNQLEGREAKIGNDPKLIKIKDFAKIYDQKIISAFPNPSKRQSYRAKLNNRIIPLLGEFTIQELTRTTIATFIKHLNGKDR